MPASDPARRSDLALATAQVVAVAPPAEPAIEPNAAPSRAVIGEMKHVWQSLNNCGPASVVMALSAMGIDVSQEDARVPLRGTNILSGMGPQKVDGWVAENFGLRSMWRNNGTNDLLRRLVANGFAPMVTQWMQDPSVSRIAHWRVVRGYDDAQSTFFVNDPMLGHMVPLSYQWFQNNWQPFSYRYLVIYEPKDEALLRAIVGDDWNDAKMRKNFYERTRAEAYTQDTSSAWIAYGEAAYGFGAFAEAVSAFERGQADLRQHVMLLAAPPRTARSESMLRPSHCSSHRDIALREEDGSASIHDPDANAAVAQQRLASSATSSAVAAPPDPFALYLALVRSLPADAPTLTE